MAQTTIVSRIRYCTRGLPSLPARIRSVRQQRSMSTSKKLVPAKALDGLGKNLWVEFSALAAATKAVNLGQGMPDFSPPQVLLDALVEANKKTSSHQYTRSQGHPRLVKALGKMYSVLHGREINPMTEIIVSLGAYSSISFLFQAFLNPGDEVILIEPFFDCYSSMASMSQASLRFVPLRKQGKQPNSAKDWVLDPKELEAAFSDKTKILLINSPHNPTGKVFMRDELEMIADLCKRFDVLCLSDEVYEHLVYSGSEHFRIATLPGMWERTVTIGSGGKTFSATGWKVGWAVGPEHLITPMQTVNSNVGYTMVTPLQEAMAEAFEVEIARLGQPDCYFNQLPRELEKTRDEFAGALKEAGFDPVIPDGGYLMLADSSSIVPDVAFDENGESYDFQFVKWMTKEKGVTAIPPSAFYSPGNSHLSGKLIRFCFCKKPETLQAAYSKLRKWKQERN